MNIKFTIDDKPKHLQLRCMGKISHDDGETWWPPGACEIHVAGNTYVLLMNGRYERKVEHYK